MRVLKTPKLPGRPLGPIAESVLGLLRNEPNLTARQIASKLQLSVPITEKTCSRLLIKGRIRVIDRVLVPQCNKRVSVYSLVATASNRTEMLAASSIFHVGSVANE